MNEQKKSLGPKDGNLLGNRAPEGSPAGLILAAGFSSRMGRCKALLDLAGQSALERVVRSLRQGGVERIVVVTGHYRTEVETEARRLGCSVAFNADYERGMFSSVRRGVLALDGAPALLLLPVDVPLVSFQVISALVAAHHRGSELAYPAFLGKRGHPPLIGHSLFPAVIGDDGSRGGLRPILEAREHLARDVAVPDEAVLLDMDSPEDYAALRAKALRRDIPNEKECRALLGLAETPEKVRRHGETVADLADRLAASLAGKVPIDRQRLRAACLLHDLARTSSDHALAGARFLRSWGWKGVADLVAGHMDGPQGGTLDEGALLFAADKAVQSSRVVGIPLRRKLMEERFRGNAEALANALDRLDRAEAIFKALKERTGQALSL